jgi:predicted nucleotidyltransferase
MAESREIRQTVQVPTINARERIPQLAIEDTVRQIVQQFRPQRIILFGSYAYGRPRRESDVDLLVVMDTPLKETEQAVRICQAIEYHFGLDLIVRTPETLNRRLALGDSFLQEVVGEGKVLYEQADG